MLSRTEHRQLSSRRYNQCKSSALWTHSVRPQILDLQSKTMPPSNTDIPPYIPEAIQASTTTACRSPTIRKASYLTPIALTPFHPLTRTYQPYTTTHYPSPLLTQPPFLQPHHLNRTLHPNVCPNLLDLLCPLRRSIRPRCSQARHVPIKPFVQSLVVCSQSPGWSRLSNACLQRTMCSKTTRWITAQRGQRSLR